jgi:hypothetical protein
VAILTLKANAQLPVTIFRKPPFKKIQDFFLLPISGGGGTSDKSTNGRKGNYVCVLARNFQNK